MAGVSLTRGADGAGGVLSVSPGEGYNPPENVQPRKMLMIAIASAFLCFGFVPSAG